MKICSSPTLEESIQGEQGPVVQSYLMALPSKKKTLDFVKERTKVHRRKTQNHLDSYSHYVAFQKTVDHQDDGTLL